MFFLCHNCSGLKFRNVWLMAEFISLKIILWIFVLAIQTASTSRAAVKSANVSSWHQKRFFGVFFFIFLSISFPNCFTSVDTLMWDCPLCVCVYRMVRPSWALPSSCARAPTQKAVRTARAPTGCATWTAALKTATAPTPWSRHAKPGQGQSRRNLKKHQGSHVNHLCPKSK